MSAQEHPPIPPEVRVWIEQGQSICIKAVTKEGDPVELAHDEARRLAHVLLDMVARIDASDEPAEG